MTPRLARSQSDPNPATPQLRTFSGACSFWEAGAALSTTARTLDRMAQAVVDQIDKEFVPYVKPVRVGTQVQFPNKDEIRHHVYSFSAPRTFQLPLYRGTPAQPVLFDKAGVVKLGCNIHDWMIGYIYVAETPYFAKTTHDGRVDLDQLPPGRYRARVWHPRMERAESETVKAVELQETAPATVEWKLRLRPEFRPRRTPLPGEPGYR